MAKLKLTRHIQTKAKKAVTTVVKKAIVESSKIRGHNNDKIPLLHKVSTPHKAISKKDKYRQKRKQLMHKFAELKKKRKEQSAQKNRENTPVVGDLKCLKDALPSLNELYQLAKKNKPELSTTLVPEAIEIQPRKLKPKQKIKATKLKCLQQVQAYQALMRDTKLQRRGYSKSE